MKKYFIDGYNLLHALRRVAALPDDFGAARQMMVEWLGRFARTRNADLTVYFDGRRGPDDLPDTRSARVRSVFVGGDADAALRKAVANEREPEEVTVVSSDREVGDPCRQRGASVEKSEAFAERLVETGGVEGRAETQTPDALARMAAAHQGLGDVERSMLGEVEDFERLAREAIAEGGFPPLRAEHQARLNRRKP